MIAYNPKTTATVEVFEHPFKQSSLIASFPDPASDGDDDDSDTEVVIVGAHQDSTNRLPWLPSPGADDDGECSHGLHALVMDSSRL
jgi:leucyl aminopeptidase